jgi:hypothetical protein
VHAVTIRPAEWLGFKYDLTMKLKRLESCWSFSGHTLEMRLSNNNRAEYARIAAVVRSSRCYEKRRYMFDVETFTSCMFCSEYCAPAAVMQ